MICFAMLALVWLVLDTFTFQQLKCWKWNAKWKCQVLCTHHSKERCWVVCHMLVAVNTLRWLSC